jgi:hypothetical protein
MAETDSVQIEVEFDGKKGFVKLKKDIEKEGSEAGQSFASSFSAATISALAAAAAAVAGALFSKKSIEAALEAERSVESFNRALVRTGQFSKLTSADFLNFASETEKSFNIASSSILDVSAKIQTVGVLAPDVLKRATVAAINLSSAYGIDLASATELVAKAADGSVSGLERQRIQVQKGATDAITFANALDAIEKKSGDAGKALGNNFSTSFDRTGIALSNLFENFGKIFTSSPIIVRLLEGIGKIFTGLSEYFEKLAKADFFGGLLRGFLDFAIPFASLITKYLGTPLEVLFNFIKAGFLSVSVFVVGFLDFIVTGFQKVILFIDKFKSIPDDIKNAVAATKDFLDKSTQSLAESSTNSIKNLLTTPISQGLGEMITNVESYFKKVPAITSAADVAVQGSAEKINKDLIKLNNDLSQALQGGLKSAISGGLASIGASLAKGENVFGNFGKTILGIFADLAIQVGTIMVSMGLGLDSLKAALTTFNGPLLIAAGAALVVLGGALKALSGGPAAAAAGGAQSSGGGVASSDPAAVSPNDIASQGPKTQVSINVEGNILDRRESGLALAEVIQEYFDTNSGVLAKA